MVPQPNLPVDQHAVHIAIYRWKIDAPIPEIEAAIDSLSGITDDVPGIQLISWGRNVSPYSAGFTHAILIVGEDDSAIDQYRNHPLHQPVAELLDSWEDEGIGVDFDRGIDAE